MENNIPILLDSSMLHDTYSNSYVGAYLKCALEKCYCRPMIANAPVNRQNGMM